MKADEPTGVSSSGTDEVEQLLTEVDESSPLVPVVEQLLDRVERVELSRDAAHRRIDELEERIEDEKGGVQTDETGSQPTEDGGMLPIERLARIEDSPDASSTIMADVTPSVERAVVLFDQFRSWSEKAPAGRVIRSGLKRLLSTATDEQLAWKQVYRACRKLEEWSKGAIQFKEHDRHGWILVADERASSLRIG